METVREAIESLLEWKPAMMEGRAGSNAEVHVALDSVSSAGILE